MRLRFQADNDLDQRIVTATKRLDPSINFQTAPGLGLHDIDDPEVLALAAREGRVLVSHERRTMPGHFRAFILTQESPGLVIVSRRLPIGRAAELLHFFGRRAKPKSIGTLSTTFRKPPRLHKAVG